MAALKEIPTREELRALFGDEKLAAWERMARLVDSLYDMETLWNDGGKRWKIEYKYRRGGKTLCCLYADEGRFGLMIIFGLEERARVEALWDTLSTGTIRVYDEAATYHDGKWVMFDETLPDLDLTRLLAVKRRPNKGK
ncbi:MAG: DUF3788 domain-containing protein [Clostridiaceae bacterium]|nr:DUF3788 domain-containing protein [Clostridiaceae bacterium]